MAAVPMPSPASISDLITMLVGKKVKVATCPPLAVSAARGFATYIDQADKIKFVGLIDMPFLAGVGAALAMIPATVVAEVVKTGKPSPVLVENAFEVMNILSSLFNEADDITTHVKIQQLLLTPPVPPEIAPRLLKPAGRVDLEVQLPGYANGKLTLLAVP